MVIGAGLGSHMLICVSCSLLAPIRRKPVCVTEHRYLTWPLHEFIKNGSGNIDSLSIITTALSLVLVAIPAQVKPLAIKDERVTPNMLMCNSKDDRGAEEVCILNNTVHFILQGLYHYS